MTELERRERHEAEIAAAHERFGAAYHAWLLAQPRPVPPFVWRVANDDAAPAANDNLDTDEAA